MSEKKRVLFSKNSKNNSESQMDKSRGMRSVGVIWIKISHPRPLGSWYMNNRLRDLSAAFMHRDRVFMVHLSWYSSLQRLWCYSSQKSCSLKGLGKIIHRKLQEGKESEVTNTRYRFAHTAIRLHMVGAFWARSSLLNSKVCATKYAVVISVQTFFYTSGPVRATYESTVLKCILC